MCLSGGDPEDISPERKEGVWGFQLNLRGDDELMKKVENPSVLQLTLPRQTVEASTENEEAKRAA